MVIERKIQKAIYRGIRTPMGEFDNGVFVIVFDEFVVHFNIPRIIFL
jgi:hypothetical protein